MDFIERFKRWVDAIDGSLPDDQSEISELGFMSKLPLQAGRKNGHIWTNLRLRICSVLMNHEPERPSNLSSETLLTLKKHLALEFLVDNVPYQPYWHVANIMGASIQTNKLWADFTRGFDDFWIQAIRIAVIYKRVALNAQLCPSPMDDEPLFHRLQKVAKAANWLKQSGFVLSVTRGRIQLDQCEMCRVAEAIDSRIDRLGGLAVARYIFKNFKIGPDRMHCRYPSFVAPIMKPDHSGYPLPVPYLLNLCVKHIGSGSQDIEPDNPVLKELFNFSRMLAAIYDVFPYGCDRTNVCDPSRVNDFLWENALFYRVFALPQFRPSDIPELIRSLFAWVTPEIENELGWTISNISNLTETILEVAQGTEVPNVINQDELYRQSGLEKLDAFSRMIGVLSHKSEVLNKDFLLPTDLTDNFWSKPLLKIDDRNYLLLNSSWCALNFYEAIIGEIRSLLIEKNNLKLALGKVKKLNERETDDKTGQALENFVRSRLSESGICVAHGKWDNFECDAVIQTSCSVIFIEIKKKNLTRRASTGDDLSLIRDIGGSLIKSQRQAAIHANKLLQDEELCLKDGKMEYKIELRNRKINLITLTLQNFGLIQSIENLTKLLGILAGCCFTAVDGMASDDEIKDLDKISNSCKDLLEKTKSSQQMSTGDDRTIPFLNCWFLNLSQLLEILDSVDSSDSFERALYDIPTNPLIF